jgi:hypothetical protein
MDANAPSFSNRSNAKRAAEAKLANGTTPAAEYELRTRDDGRAEIVWKTTPIVPARIDGVKGAINRHDTTNSGDARATASTGPGEPAIAADQQVGHAKPAEQSRRRAADDAPSKGVLPQKPVITSKTNQHYQSALRPVGRTRRRGRLGRGPRLRNHRQQHIFENARALP